MFSDKIYDSPLKGIFSSEKNSVICSKYITSYEITNTRLAGDDAVIAVF